jgi:hypothetical protein
VRATYESLGGTSNGKSRRTRTRRIARSEHVPRGVAPQTMKTGLAPARGTERGIYAASADYLAWRKTWAARGGGRTVKRHECRAPIQSVFHPCLSVAQDHFLVSPESSGNRPQPARRGEAARVVFGCVLAGSGCLGIL